MQFSGHVLGWSTGTLLICFLSFVQDLKSQSWIVDTPTGNLSTWIIQRHPNRSQIAELLFLNHSQEPVQYDAFNTNNNYLEINCPSGLSTITRRYVLKKTLNRTNDPAAEKHIQWDVDFYQLINGIDFFEDGIYLITWHMETSFGTLSSEPVEFHYKK